MNYDPEFIFNHYNRQGEITLRVRGIRNMPARFRNALIYNDPDHQWRIKPQAKTGWINIHWPYVSQIYGSKRTADNFADILINGVPRIACIQITYTEGEGL